MPAPERTWRKVDSLAEIEAAAAVARALEQAAPALRSEDPPAAFFESSDGLTAIVLTPAAVRDARHAGALELTLDGAGEPSAPIVLTATAEVELRQGDLLDMVPSGAAAAVVGYPAGETRSAQYRTGKAGTLSLPAVSAKFDLYLVRLQPAAAASQVRALASKLPERPDTLAQREEWFGKRSGRHER